MDNNVDFLDNGSLRVILAVKYPDFNPIFKIKISYSYNKVIIKDTGPLYFKLNIFIPIFAKIQHLIIILSLYKVFICTI